MNVVLQTAKLCIKMFIPPTCASFHVQDGPVCSLRNVRSGHNLLVQSDINHCYKPTLHAVRAIVGFCVVLQQEPSESCADRFCFADRK